MAATTEIQWTDATWTPIRARNLKTGKIGWHCEHATTGCIFCYSEGFNKRLGTGLDFKPGHRKDIEIFLDEEMLLAPLRWKRPRMIFCCSMTDLFADFVPDEFIDKMFAVMALCPQHTFQVLTKRAGRMREYMARRSWPGPSDDEAPAVDIRIRMTAHHAPAGKWAQRIPWPLPNVWLGVSAERQEEADERIPLLLQTPAAVRFVSAEPLLGPIDLTRWLPRERFYNAICEKCGHTSSTEHFREARNHDDADVVCPKCDCIILAEEIGTLDWIIVGGESGKNARPMHPAWARSLRDQCAAAGMLDRFFYKQWGEWAPCDAINVSKTHALCASIPTPPVIERNCTVALDFFQRFRGKHGADVLARVGKKASGRLLDGVEHNGMPRTDRAAP